MKSLCVIVKHDAKKAGLHYDLRVKIKTDVFKSWVLIFDAKKDLIIDKKINMIETKDHTTKEATFTGVIKNGYGEGVIKLYSESNIDIIRNDGDKIILRHRDGLYKNETWALIKFKDSPNKKVWGLIKKK